MSLLATLWRDGWLRAVDHGLALSLAHARAATPDRVQAAAALASRALALGHGRVPLDRLPALFAAIDAEHAPPALPDVDEWLAELRASPWVHDADAAREDPAPAADAPGDRVLVLAEGTVALRRYWDYERRVAAAVAARLDPVPTLQLVTGGPGTGKTTHVAHWLAAFARDWSGPAPPRIALAAPTGKAAARLAESVREAGAGASAAFATLDPARAAWLPASASTLHRLLGWQRDGFRHGRDRPLAVDALVVDEASMVDLALMCRLLEAVPPTAQLLVVGDPDQLPPVDAGDVLAALCAASDVPGAPLAARRLHLTTPRRQLAGLDVATLARHVGAGDADATVRGLGDGAFPGVRWRSGGERALHDAVRDEAVPAYRALVASADAGAALRAARGLRLLTAVRDGPAGSVALNALVGAALDPASGGEGWYPGKLVIVTENAYRQQLFNGDIGIAWPDEQGELRVWFDADPGAHPAPSAGGAAARSWLPAALPAHEPAFALTVHKAQGSEFDTAWLVLPDAGSRVASRELLYTGLTRARRALVLWAGEPALRQAIARRAVRWSGLASKLGA